MNLGQKVTPNQREYRKIQFKEVATEYFEFWAKIKIIKPDGETKWMDITEKELKQIKHILTSEI